jgi:hypothetical protein
MLYGPVETDAGNLLEAGLFEMASIHFGGL